MYITSTTVWFCLALIYLKSPVVAGKRALSEKEKKDLARSGFDPDDFKPAGDGAFMSNDTTKHSMAHANLGTPHMPERFKCDGCYAVAMKLKKKLKAFEKKYRKNNYNRNGVLTEVDIMEAFDDVCKDKFTEYGIKHVGEGTMSFSGPGLITHAFEGMMEYHRIWGYRLQKICEDVAGLYDEDIIYKWHMEGEEFDRVMHVDRNKGDTDGQVDFRQRLCEYYCKDSGVTRAEPLAAKKKKPKRRRHRRHRDEL